MKSTVVSLTHACASLCFFKHGYLSLQKYSLFGRRLRGKLYWVTYKSILSQKACKHAFRHASPQAHLRVALLLQMRWLGSQACDLLVCIITQMEKKNHTFWYGSSFLTGSYLSSQAASSQVLSTYKGLTTVFGMGTGGSP